MKKIFIPSGRIPTKQRPFRNVVADIRHAVFSIIRLRPLPNGKTMMSPLGSGFFVSPKVFVTCCHVIQGSGGPHESGDRYLLKNNLDGTFAIDWEVNGEIGTAIHLYPGRDFAILLPESKSTQSYLAVSYADVPVGQDIGVAGYPLPAIIPDENGAATVSGLIYRVAKGVVTAYYRTTINFGEYTIQDSYVVEVNFLFVPGNSGGPIFEAETGRVIGYVKGFTTRKIGDRVEKWTNGPLPEGITQDSYLDGVQAIYSVGLTLEPVRAELEKFGVSL